MCHINLISIKKCCPHFQYITINGSKVIFRTNKNASNFRLISIDLKNPLEWTTLLAEDQTDVLEWAQVVDNNKLIVGYMRDVKVIHIEGNCSADS